MRNCVLWVDDERPVSTFIKNKFSDYDIITCKNYEDAVLALTGAVVFAKIKVVVCFDHDLGEKRTGYDLAKFIVEHEVPLEGFEIHSMNPVGVTNIRQLLTHYGYSEISRTK